jgi:hypothetical protein
VRKLMLLTLVGLAGAGVAVLPSLGSAQATTASFTAVDNGTFFSQPTWSANGTTQSAVTILPGGTVTFSYPAGGSSIHNVVFTGPQPTSCTQTATPYGYQIQAVPPLPYIPEPPAWSGTCRFDTAGTYPFQDGNRGATMSGTVTVGTTTTTTTTQTTTTQTTGTTTTTFHEPPIPAASSTLRATAVQHGTVVRGRLHVTAPGSRLIAELFLGGTRVGRSARYGVADGTQRFAVGLNATGRRALRRSHRLALTLRTQVLLTGALGPTYLSRHVTLIG